MSLTVAVLKGGGSLERPVSLRSGAQIEDALERLGHDLVPIDVGADMVAHLHESAPDVAFIALHGRDGEDGTVQELLAAIGVPYTGSGPGACMRCTDKALAKHLLREAGLPTPDFFAFKESTVKELDVASALPDIERALGFPLVVKPASQGSALGIKFAASSAELPGAIVGALSYDRKVLLERHIEGRDLAVSVLDEPAGAHGGATADGGAEDAGGEGMGARDVGGAVGPGGGSPGGVGPASRGGGLARALPIVEAIPREEDFYSYESRYEIGKTTFVCPAELPREIERRARELALESYRLLGCHGYARVDLMLAADGEGLYVLEVNVVPGMTETSLLPQAADAAGIEFDELVERMLASAFTRGAATAVAR